MAKDFTDDEIAALRADYEGGVGSMEALAKRFRIGPKALRAMAERLSFRPRPSLPPFQRRARPAGEDPSGTAPPDQSPEGGGTPAEGKKTTSKTTKTAARKKPSSKKPASKPTAKSPASTSSRPRAAQPARGGEARSKAPRALPASLKPLDLAAAAQRIQSAAGQELTRIQTRLETGEDVERHARALASLVKSLGDLARLEETLGGRRDPERADDGAWTLDDLRAEFARRIDRLAPDPVALE